MLNVYLAQTSALLQNPSAPTTLYTTATLTQAINTARSQIAGEGQCIRSTGELTLAAGQNSYQFAAINGLGAGIAGPLNVRLAALAAQGTGQTTMRAWPWEWFFNYYLSVSPNLPSGAPTDWAQQGQGVSGTLWVNPVPNVIKVLNLDCVCYPNPLVNDSTTEAIPYPWTDCVQYFAAYLALLGAQSSARQGDADRMFARYTEFSVRARNMSTPTALPVIYQRSGLIPPGAATQQRAAG